MYVTKNLFITKIRWLCVFKYDMTFKNCSWGILFNLLVIFACMSRMASNSWPFRYILMSRDDKLEEYGEWSNVVTIFCFIKNCHEIVALSTRALSWSKKKLHNSHIFNQTRWIHFKSCFITLILNSQKKKFFRFRWICSHPLDTLVFSF